MENVLYYRLKIIHILCEIYAINIRLINFKFEYDASVLNLEILVSKIYKIYSTI